MIERKLFEAIIFLIAFVAVCYGYGIRVPGLTRTHSLSLQMTEGFGKGSIVKPTVVTPSMGNNTDIIEKFLMMYTCKLCLGRNTQMISKVAYYKGMVVSTCKHCKQYHLIADNERKLDMGKDYGPRIADFLQSQGETVQRLSVSLQELEDNYLVDKDGVLTMVPKAIGQLPADSTVVELPTKRPKSWSTP